jgi:hypothetical protein
LTWPSHCSLFFSMMSTMSGFPFVPLLPLYFHSLFFPTLIFLPTSVTR